MEKHRKGRERESKMMRNSVSFADEEIVLKNNRRLAMTKVPVERNVFEGKAFGKSRGSVTVQTSFLPLISIFVSLKR